MSNAHKDVPVFLCVKQKYPFRFRIWMNGGIMNESSEYNSESSAGAPEWNRIQDGAHLIIEKPSMSAKAKHVFSFSFFFPYISTH